jgi:protein involved in polysaccharide export with SLBB domain
LEKSGGVRAGAWLKRGEIVRCRNPEAATEAAADGDQPAPIAKPMPEQPLEAQPTGLPPAPPPAAVSERRHEVVAFDVSAALAGDKEANQVLEEFDWVRIYDTADVLPETRASIAGAVYKPGTYVLTPNMSVSDLIFKAGGMKQNALTQRIELFRTELGQQPKLYILDLDPVISGADKTNDIVLADQDAVYVRRNAYLDQRNRIFLSGEVRYPGEYIAEPGERLSSILKRAGGYTEKAFLPAAVFKRVSVQELQKVSVQRFIQAQREALLREESVAPVEELTESERRLKQTSIQFRRQLLELVGAVNYPGRMVIKIDAIERMEGSRDDILIEDGDSLFIPSTPSNVQVLGAVYNAMSLIYEPGKNLDYYLAKVGGPTREADKGQIYVVKANGEVNYKFARAYPIERGDTIVVPADVRVRTDWRQLLLDTSKIIANLAIGAAVATQ